MEENITKTREDYGSGIARPKINEIAKFELKGQFLKKLRDNTFSGSDTEDAHEYIEKCMTRSSNKKLVTPYEEPGRVLRSARKLFKTTSIDYSSLPKFDLFSDLEYQCEEEVTEAMGKPTMEENITKTREDYGSGIARPKINEIARAANRWLRNERAGSIVTWETLKMKFMSKYYFIVLDMPEDIKVPLIIGRPFLSTAHDKIDVFKKKIDLRVGDDKIVFNSDNPTSNISTRRTWPMTSNNINFIASLVPAKLPILHYLCMNWSSNKELVTPYEKPERVLRSARKLFKTTSIDYSSSPRFDLFSDLEYQCEKEVTEAMGKPPMEENITKTREDYCSSIAGPKINEIARKCLVGFDKFIFLIDFIVLDMPEDITVPLIIRRPFLSTAHAKIDVFKKKIDLRVGDDKIVFNSDNLTSNISKRVYVLGLRERMELDLKARLIGKALILNRSLDLKYGDYVELNDLNEPLELRRNQVEDLDKIKYQWTNIVEAFINVCIFVGNFSVVTDFTVVENMDAYRDQDMGEVIVGELFCQEIYVKARRFDGMITIYNGNDSVTYQTERSHPRLQCNKMRPLLKEVDTVYPYSMDTAY
uniref:Reverse transcriptase domain-containing protein n=1 Tax=Tanacetum cinerariifolium TaxID=118510 RepID=A0A6L2KJC3_TANCI|nr:hypothetical protein [Tanacetum cinerariifolium]